MWFRWILDIYIYRGAISQLLTNSCAWTHINTRWKYFWICWLFSGLKVKVTYSQVWWPILRIHALHLTHPKCTHTAVNTHTPWTHTLSSGQSFMLQRRGAVGGSVPGLRASQSGYWEWRERWTFTPPTDNPCWTETWTRNLSITSPTLNY